MKTILFLAFCLTLSAVAVTDESVDITLKETAHLLSVQGDARAAANQCFELLKDTALTSDQAKRVYPVLVRVMRELNDREMILQAIAACEERRIQCAELRDLQGFAAPTETNPDTVQIRDAIEYMWNDLDWQNNNRDYSVFKCYLDALSERTNISQVVKAQASLLKEAIRYANSFKKNSILKDQQYKRLLADLNRTDVAITPLTVYESIQRIYLASKEYLSAGETTMAGLGIDLLQPICLDKGKFAGDLVSVLCVQIYQILPNLPSKYRCLEEPMFVRIKASKLDDTMNVVNKGLLLSAPYGSPNWKYLTSWSRVDTHIVFDNIAFPVSLTSMHQLIEYVMLENKDFSNMFSRITFPDTPLDWETVKINSNNTKFCEIDVKGYWNDIEVEERNTYISNILIQIAQPLEELRKYAERTEKRSLSSLIESEKIVAADRSDNQLTEEEVRELWREFTRIGTKDSVKGKALLKKVKPYIEKMKEIKNSIEYLYIEYPDNRKFVQGRIYEIDYQLIKPATEIHMKRWEFWSRMPEVEAACEVLQTVNSTNNLGEISRKLIPQRLISSITTKDICTFYIAAGYDLKKGLSLDELRTFWNKLYAYYNYVIMNPEIENNAAYDAFLIEQLLPVFLQSARVRPNAFQLPEKLYHEDDLTRARIITAFQAIISHTNTTDKPMFVEQTVKQLVSDLRADAKITDTSADVSGGIYASLMRDFLEQGKVDTEKGKELLDKISALPDMPLDKVEFNKLLMAYPDDRITVSQALRMFELLNYANRNIWICWSFLPALEKYTQQFSQVNDLSLLRTFNPKQVLLPYEIMQSDGNLQNTDLEKMMDRRIKVGVFPDPKWFESAESFHIYQKAFFEYYQDKVKLPENASPEANAIEKLIPVYVEIAKNNPDGLMPVTYGDKGITTPLIREAFDLINTQKDAADISRVVETTLTELVKKMRKSFMDSKANAKGTVLVADDKLADSYGESAGKLGVFLIVVDADVQSRNRLDTDYGMLVYRIKKLSPAAKAGIMARDVIIDINGKKVDNTNTFTCAINEAYKSDKKAISMTVKRQAEIKQLSVEME